MTAKCRISAQEQANSSEQISIWLCVNECVCTCTQLGDKGVLSSPICYLYPEGRYWSFGICTAPINIGCHNLKVNFPQKLLLPLQGVGWRDVFPPKDRGGLTRSFGRCKTRESQSSWAWKCPWRSSGTNLLLYHIQQVVQDLVGRANIKYFKNGNAERVKHKARSLSCLMRAQELAQGRNSPLTPCEVWKVMLLQHDYLFHLCCAICLHCKPYPFQSQ